MQRATRADPTTEPAFNQYAEDYDVVLERALASTGENGDYFASRRTKWYARCLRSLEIRPVRVLDYGCGTGSTSPLLVRALGCTSILGVDPSDKCIGSARKLYGSQIVTFEALPHYKPAGDMDAAYCNGVFHHIVPEQRLPNLRLIYESLRPGGVFAFWENNPWNPGTNYVMSKCTFDKDAVKISPVEASRLVGGVGFDILRIDYLFFFPHALRGLRVLEGALRKVPVGGQYQLLCRKPESARMLQGLAPGVVDQSQAHPAA